MTKRRHVLILIGLVGVMVVVYARALGRHSGPPSHNAPAPSTDDRAPRSASPAAHPDARSAAVDETEIRRAQHQQAERLAWGRDPFGHAETSGSAGDLILSGILWDPKGSVAIINGQMMRVGEELDGYRVIDIAQDHVSVTDGTRTVQLHTAP